MTKKIRLDFSAHVSVVVAVDDEEDMMEDKALEIAEDYLATRGCIPTWELDDGGIDEVDDTEEAINE